jgi:hypothetical protein
MFMTRRSALGSDKSYVCELNGCHKAYYDKRNLLRHQRKKHGQIDPTLPIRQRNVHVSKYSNATSDNKISDISEDISSDIFSSTLTTIMNNANGNETKIVNSADHTIEIKPSLPNILTEINNEFTDDEGTDDGYL